MEYGRRGECSPGSDSTHTVPIQPLYPVVSFEGLGKFCKELRSRDENEEEMLQIFWPFHRQKCALTRAKKTASNTGYCYNCNSD